MPLFRLSIQCCLSRLIQSHTPTYTPHSSLSNSSCAIPLPTLPIHRCLPRLIRRHTPTYTLHSLLSVSTRPASYPCLHFPFIAVCLDSSGAIPLLTLPIHRCLSRLIWRHTSTYTSHSSLSALTHPTPYPYLHSPFIAVCLDSASAIPLLTVSIHCCLS